MYEVAVVKKFYVHGIAAVNLSKIYFLKNAKKTCKSNNRDLNRDWIILLSMDNDVALTLEKNKSWKK